jgi:hypothetical protein
VTHRGDPENDLAALEQPNRPGRLADNNRQRPRDMRDGRGGPVPRAKTTRKHQVRMRRVNDLTGRLDRPVTINHKRPVELRNLLDGFTNTQVAEVPVFFAIASERVEAQGPRAGEHRLDVAHDNQRAHAQSQRLCQPRP